MTAPMLSIVIPHWPLDEETNDALRRCVVSLPPECERVIVVNDGTGYGRNVNVGLRLATGDYIAVVNNDCRLIGGDVNDLCVPETVTSPLIIGERQGFGESIEPGGFHGCFWVVPRSVLESVGLLDDRFEWGYWEDDDYLTRLHESGISTRQVSSVRVKHVGGLTTVKVPEHRDWLQHNEQVFKEKWGWLPTPIARYRRARETEIWHLCQNCSRRPESDYEEAVRLTSGDVECEECRLLRDRQECAFY